MSITRSLTLLAPRLADAMQDAQAGGAALPPAFERLLARASHRTLEGGKRSSDALDVSHIALLHALDLAAADYPEAAVMRAGAAGQLVEGCWLRADFLHLAAGMRDVAALALTGRHSLRRAEREELMHFLAPDLQQGGFEWDRSTDDVLLRARVPLEVSTVTPDAAARRGIADAMPQGADAVALRRLMTELQMLLHDHPVNSARAQRGVPAANALWLYGAGEAQPLPARSLPRAVGDDAFLRGIYALHGQPCERAVAHADLILPSLDAPTIVLVDDDDLVTFTRAWIEPVWDALRRGGLQRLDLLFGEWRGRLTRADTFAFWRRTRPDLSGAAQDESR